MSPRHPLGWLLLSALASPAAQAQPRPTAPSAKRALAIEDYYRVQTAGAPTISPDGRWVAFTVSTRIEETNAEPTEVWLAATDGTAPPRRVSPANVSASAPTWRRDTLELRANGRSWRLLPGRSDSLTPVAPAAAGGELPLPAPTGTRVALLRDVAVPAAAPDTRTPFEQRHDARFKGRQFDWLNFQRDGAVYPVPDRTNPRLFPAQELWLVNAPGAEPRRLTALGLRPQTVRWNRAGTALVFSADSGYRDERRYAAAQVYIARIDGTVTRLTPEADCDCDDPSFSPDGQWVLYTKQITTNALIARKSDRGSPTDLALRPATGGTERVLTSDWDLIPENPRWSADGRFIYFSAAIAGAQHLFRVASTGGRVEQITTGTRRLTTISFDSAFTRMAYLATAIDAPPEVFVAAIDGTQERRLSTVTTALTRDVALSTADRLQFPSADGTPIEGWLLKPFGYDPTRRYPLVVSNHGGPHSADGYAFDFKAQYLAANGYFVLKVNFRSSTGYGEPFLWATWGAWGTKDGQDVMAGVDYAIAHYPIDRTQVATMGHSYGGFMTNWLITQYPDRFAAAIPGAGIVNWVSDYGTADIAVTKETEFYGTPWDSTARAIMIRQSPLSYAGRVRTPTLLIHGEIDERVPYSEAEQFFVALKKNGVPAAIIQYKDMPHSISGSWNQVHRMLHERAWLDQWMRKPTP
ncbi:MAG: S9 family peptidase [Gemmatimonadaceae bacterium]|nr:S9 family peptidase [Gemmatimonadaceae bacterium]